MGKGYGASCVSRTPHMALKSHSLAPSDALGRAEGLSLALWTVGSESRVGITRAWHHTATAPAKPFPADEM